MRARIDRFERTTQGTVLTAVRAATCGGPGEPAADLPDNCHVRHEQVFNFAPTSQLGADPATAYVMPVIWEHTLGWSVASSRSAIPVAAA